DLVVRRHRPDRDPVAVVADAPQVGDPAQVDQHGRSRQPQPQHRDEALPTGEDLGVLTGLLQRGHGLVDRAGPDVVERRGDHWTSSSCGLFGSIEPRPAPGEWVSTGVSKVARPCASWIARQTRCGVHGISTSVTPRCRTASRTPLTIAGVEAIVPASPTPLTPSGFVV